MPHDQHKSGTPARNALSIRLNESVVFTRGVDSGRQRSHHEGPSSIIRGLLTLELSKPTRISSIEVELQAKAYSAWPEGTGARRIEVSETHKIYSSTITFFRAKNGAEQRPPLSVGPGLALLPDEVELLDDEGHRVSTRITTSAPPSRANSPPAPPARRVYEHEQTSPYTPPYTPRATTPVHEYPMSPGLSPVPSSSRIHRGDESPAQTLEDFRKALRAAELHHRPPSAGFALGLPPAASGSSASSSIRSRQDLSLSRRPSIEDVPEDEPGFRTIGRSSSPGEPRSRGTSSGRDSRGRKTFGLSNVFETFKDRVRSKSPRTRENSIDRGREDRGRTMEKGKGKVDQSPVTSLGGKLGHILRMDSDEGQHEHSNSKEFQPGTYTYPIVFNVPSNSPPSMHVSYGNVTWKLKANVHRPGAFTSKLSAQRDVTIIASPGDHDTEDSENILVERIWDQQLQYLIGISGRSFYIGGSIPISFALMPLTKVKIHRITVVIEEKAEYTSDMKKVVKSDIVRRVPLLNLKANAMEGGHILPLPDGNMEDSPLFDMIPEHSDLSDMASQFMGPGPWKFNKRLPLPLSCSMLSFTNRNRRANILVTHALRVVMRVQRGDDDPSLPAGTKPKLFDIVVQTPIHILSCRCDPRWQALPLYSANSAGGAQTQAQEGDSCPCAERSAAAGSPAAHLHLQLHHHHRVLQATPEDSPLGSPGLEMMETLLDRNTLFERLVSGQESVTGEAPPAYEAERPVVVL